MSIIEYKDSDKETFRRMIETNPDLINEETDSNGDTLLAILVNQEKIDEKILEKIAILLDNNADSNVLLKSGYTPFMIACSNAESRNIQLIKMLLEKGANPFSTGEKDFSAIDIVNPQSNLLSYYRNPWEECYKLLSNMSAEDVLRHQNSEIRQFVQKIKKEPADIEQTCFDFCEYINREEKHIEDVIVSIKEFVSPAIIEYVVIVNKIISFFLRRKFSYAEACYLEHTKQISHKIYEKYRNRYIILFVHDKLSLSEDLTRELSDFCANPDSKREHDLIEHLSHNGINIDGIKETLSVIPEDVGILRELLEILPSIAAMKEYNFAKADSYIEKGVIHNQERYFEYRKAFSRGYLITLNIFTLKEIDALVSKIDSISSLSEDLQKYIKQNIAPTKISALRAIFPALAQRIYLDELLLDLLVETENWSGLQEFLAQKEIESGNPSVSPVVEIIKNKLSNCSIDEDAREILNTIRKDLKTGFSLLEKLKNYDFRHADEIKSTSASFSKREYEHIKSIFVKKYLENILNKDNPDDKKISLDREQVAAIIDMSHDVLVTARAGSGKTTTIVNKIIYEITKYDLKPSEIRAFVFNRGARYVLNNRLKDYGQLARTFHSFAWNAYRDLFGKTPNVIDIDAKEDKTTYIAEILEKGNIIQTRQSLYQSIRDSRFDMEGTISGQLLMANTSLPIVTKYIADFLFEHNISFSDTELNFKLGDTLFRNKRTEKLFEVDFQAYSENLGIKFFIRCGRESLLEDFKRQYNGEGVLVELVGNFDEHTRREEIEDSIREALETNQFQITDRDPQIALQDFYKKNKPNILSFLETLISRYQQLRWNYSQIKNHIEKYAVGNPTDFNIPALKTSLEVFKDYDAELKKNRAMDFNLLLGQITDQLDLLIHDDKTLSSAQLKLKERLQGWKLLFIDEFQDFNPLFGNLIEKIRELNPSLRLFCVGDDWQEINTFAGSDIRLFNTYKEKSSQKDIVVNHRSNDYIVSLANSFMEKNNRSGASGRPAHRESSSHDPLLFQSELTYFDIKILRKICPKRTRGGLVYAEAILRIIIDNLLNDENAINYTYLVLSRRDKLKEKIFETYKSLYKCITFRKNLTKLFENIDIEFSTAHGSKGQEADVTIILVEKNSFPLIHATTKTLDRFFEQDSMLHEQNLFYVALTRSKKQLYFIHPKKESCENRFISHVLNTGKIHNYKYESLPNLLNNHNKELIDLWNRKRLLVKERQNFSDTEKEIRDITTIDSASLFFNENALSTENNKYPLVRCVEDAGTYFWFMRLYIPKKGSEKQHANDPISLSLLDFKNPKDLYTKHCFLGMLKKRLGNGFAIVTVPSSTVGKESPFSAIIPDLVKSNHLIDASSCLVRIRSIKPAHEGGTRDIQTHLDSIRLDHPEMVQGKNVLLIDDIKTTGNSLRACEKILREQGKAKSVLKFTLGKTVYFKTPDPIE